ncbi:MAG: tRNA 2-thiouridine(34) synthase MnmA [Acidobacteria bacterium]|nr:tRNA 2-thiouridine(34) synthase MnmA [Acidobacteriota bacterium]
MPEPLIAVAMSGGVDSSVVAGLMKREGQNIVGMTMQLWNQRRLPELASDKPTGRCCSIDDVYDARYVAQLVGIPYYVVNFEDAFEKAVVRPFVDDYLHGRTPIPCTLCNNFIKFDTFIEMAEGVGAEKIATGHYARITQNPLTGRWELRRAADASKDQTYFLFGLTQAQLSRTLFPLGGMVKSDVRELAKSLALPIADKGDSQEICFVPNGDYKAFIEAYCREQEIPLGHMEGDIVTRDGQVLGGHAGYHSYTVGQRRGLGVATGEPLYVIATEPETRRVVVGKETELQTAVFTAGQVNWISIPPIHAPTRAQVRIRNRHMPADATLMRIDDTRVQVRFDAPQRAVTPGQGAVFYEGDLVLGGGWID